MKKSIPAFCLALVLAFVQSSAWSQTKSERRGAWFKGAQESSHKAHALYGKMIDASAKRHDIPSRWLGGIMLVESSGDRDLRGGLMQAGESAKHATGMQCNVRKPRCSIEVSAAYLQKIQRDYDFDLPHTILAYNMGPSAARRIKNPSQQKYFHRFMYAAMTYDDVP